MFLIEGRRSVEEALERPELIKAVLLDENLREEYFASSFKECYMLGSNLMKHVCSTENPQGIAAIMEKPTWHWNDFLEKAGIIILLDRVSDPGNIGSILRSCWALGIKGVLMTKGCADPYSPKVVRSTMGAILNIPLFLDLTQSQFDELQDHNYKFMCSDINKGEKYYSVKYDSKSVIVVGSEAQGVSDEVKKRCDRFIKIPMNPEVDSLNVAAACAIIIAETWRQCQEEAELA
jgi:TrmH family RNA methyltransferase